MFYYTHQILFYLHVFFGCFALLVFWLPIWAKKGAKNHILFGKAFAYGMYAVALSGMLMSVLTMIDPLTIRQVSADIDALRAQELTSRYRSFAFFLFALSVLVFYNTRQSILVLKAKSNRALLKSWLHLTLLLLLAASGIALLIIGLQQQSILFQVFAGLCLFNVLSSSRYIYKAELKQREWLLEHLGNILGAGIGAHTAFFIFGGSRFFAEIFTGQLMMIPWIAPGVFGTFLIVFFTKKYKKQYKVG